MTAIIEAIDEYTTNLLPTLNKKLFGFCELAHRTVDGADQPIPVTINGTSDREQVSLDDRYEFMTWIRIPGKTQVADNDQWNFGFKEARFQTVNFRWVIAHKVELGEDLIYQIIDTLPEKLEVVGYQFVFVNPGATIDHDHETIYFTELGKTVYEKHRFTWNMYVIDLAIEFIVNVNCVSSGSCCENSLLTEENEDCLITE